MANLLSYLGCCLIWSSTWLFIKTGLDSFSPLTFLALRFLIAGPMLMLVGHLSRESQPRDAETWGYYAKLGFGMMMIPYSLIYFGESRLPSGLTAVLFAMQPIFAMVFAHFLLSRERFRPAQLLGMLLALGGVILVCLSTLRGATEWSGAAAVLVSAVIQGYMAVFAKRNSSRKEHYMPLAWANVIGGGTLAVAALITEPRPILNLKPLGVGSLIYLAVLGSAVAFVLVFRLFRAWEATKTSTISLVTPPLAIVWGWLFLHEHLDWNFALGSALVVLGIWQVSRVPARAAAEH